VIGTGWDLLELRPLAMSLEDIFMELTTRVSDRNDKSDKSNKRDKRVDGRKKARA